MILCHPTRAALETNNNLKNWPLWNMMCTPKVVIKPKCKISDARFKNDENPVFLSLSSLPRKRVNELLNSTLFWIFFRSLVSFEGHYINKIDTILIGSWSFFSTIRSKISNLFDRNLYMTVLNDVVYNIISNWVIYVMKKFLFDVSINFIVKSHYVLERSLMN